MPRFGKCQLMEEVRCLAETGDQTSLSEGSDSLKPTYEGSNWLVGGVRLACGDQIGLRFSTLAREYRAASTYVPRGKHVAC